MDHNKKIIAVIVTYNRCELLKRCINNIKSQSSPPDEILVINNGSTDKTLDFLNLSKITTITQNNIGSAGGWARGIDYAISRNFDAVWLMDDDGYPEKFALENLRNLIDEDTSCISSILVKENEVESFVFPYPAINKKNKPALFSWPRKIMTRRELERRSINHKYPFAHLFNGALVSIKAIRKIGNVNKRYFIYGDELDYFFRLSKAGNVYSTTKSIHFHPDVNKRSYSPIKIYYYLKNTLIINKKYYRNPLIRQVSQIINILLIILRRNGILFFINLIFGKYRKLVPMAINRGIRGKIGSDYEK